MSRISVFVLKYSWRAPVAQLDRASGSGPEGRTFESCRVYQVFKGDPTGVFFLRKKMKPSRKVHTAPCECFDILMLSSECKYVNNLTAFRNKQQSLYLFLFSHVID